MGIILEYRQTLGQDRMGADFDEIKMSPAIPGFECLHGFNKINGGNQPPMPMIVAQLGFE